MRVDSADTVEGAWVAFEDVGKIAVVPAVVNDLDEYGAKDLICVHEVEELFDRGVFGGRAGFWGEGEGWVVLPDVNVGVDKWSSRCCRRWAGRDCCCGRGDEEAATAPHVVGSEVRSCVLQTRMDARRLCGE